MARKGWGQLSTDYRRRLERGGITQADYEAGRSLQKARGHKHPPGIGEKAYERLLRQARASDWIADLRTGERLTRAQIDDLIRSEIERGTKGSWISERIRQRAIDQRIYRVKGDRNPGRAKWLKRRQTVAIELYWYH